MKEHTLIRLASLMLLAACARGESSAPVSRPSGEPTAARAAALAPSLSVPSATPSPEQPAGDASPTLSEQVAPTATATPDIRPSPERWRSWPVVPTVSARSRQIYDTGLARGNGPHAFSKVGDCQNTPEVFLGIYDQPGAYRFDPAYVYLQETVDHFAGSFIRDSIAVRGGFNLASVLSPLWADPTQCESGETPLACELRVHRPSIVLISMETWFPGRSEQTYEDYLRQIVEYAISRGVVPILATKADNVEGDHSINRATAQVAHDYDVPLWNFWLAVQPLAQHGIDWERDPQGFHITTEAWGVRSYTALEALHAVWSGLTGEAARP